MKYIIGLTLGLFLLTSNANAQCGNSCFYTTGGYICGNCSWPATYKEDKKSPYETIRDLRDSTASKVKTLEEKWFSSGKELDELKANLKEYDKALNTVKP